MLWPWTTALSQLPHMELIPEVKPVVEEYTSNGYRKPDLSEVLAKIKSKKVKQEVKKYIVEPEPDIDEEDNDIKGTDNAIS